MWHGGHVHFFPPNIFDQVLRFSFFSGGCSFFNFESLRINFPGWLGALVVRARGGCAAALNRVIGFVECLISGARRVFAPGWSLRMRVRWWESDLRRPPTSQQLPRIGSAWRSH